MFPTQARKRKAFEAALKGNINPLINMRLVDEQPNFVCVERRGRIFASDEKSLAKCLRAKKKLFSSISSCHPTTPQQQTENGKLNASTATQRSLLLREINPRKLSIDLDSHLTYIAKGRARRKEPVIVLSVG